ncbi:unnamed protein product [Alternaria alternata]
MTKIIGTTIKEKRHIIIIGAGVSGILLGCACDVPSDIYQYSFAPTKDWSKLFASSGEIQSYLSHVVDHFDLAHHIEFKTTVTRSAWSEQESKWLLNTECNGIVNKVRKADVLINAAGILNHYRYPDIPGLDSYRGRLIHTADWDHSVDLAGKRVSVIGAGASAVQVIPQIQPLVKELSVYIRTPSWITSLPDSFEGVDNNPDNPPDYIQRCKSLESYYNKLFPVFYRDSNTQTQKREELELWMRERIADPSLRKNLIPNYELGCRRISPGEPFLQALQKPNVTCVFSPILTYQPEGLETHDGIGISDVIIAATGFDTSFRPRFPLLGRNGVDLRDLWKDDPISYMGLGCAEFPNYLSMLGPNCPVANGSLIGM